VEAYLTCQWIRRATLRIIHPVHIPTTSLAAGSGIIMSKPSFRDGVGIRVTTSTPEHRSF
jgi:hypothetical protein